MSKNLKKTFLHPKSKKIVTKTFASKNQEKKPLLGEALAPPPGTSAWARPRRR
jgi:hypothetical protein